MIPDGVVRHARVGRQQLPQLSQRGHVLLFADLGAEPPQRQRRLPPVQIFLLPGAERFDNSREMAEAVLLDLLDVRVPEVVEIRAVSRERVDQNRTFGPAHLRLSGNRMNLPVLQPDLLDRPLRAVGGRSPPVGAADDFVDLPWNALAEAGEGQRALPVGRDRAFRQLARVQQARQRPARPVFVSRRVA